jgi:hypothetical protein
MNATAIAAEAGHATQDATGPRICHQADEQKIEQRQPVVAAPAPCEFSQVPAAVLDAEFAERGALLARAGGLIEHCALSGDRPSLERAIRAARSITLDLCELFREVCPREASR